MLLGVPGPHGFYLGHAGGGRRAGHCRPLAHEAFRSTAARTRETWKLVVPKLSERPRTVYEDRLYEASAGEIIAVLNEVPNDTTDVLVVGHNPGVQAVADALAGSSEGDALERMSRGGFPTSALAVIRFTGPWKSLEPGTGTLATYWAPHEQP